jgi:EAL domain-containing protein (putative c-di-GMP-specific phosphodiesterase class I)/CRP-like cAMP-binding protein
MSKVSQRHKYSAGEIIFRQGDPSELAYIIDSGDVEIYINHGDGDVVVSSLTTGEIFGEMGVIDDSPRSASARAKTDCKLSLVKKEQLKERIQMSDPVVKLVIRRLLTRVRNNLLLHFDDEKSAISVVQNEYDYNKSLKLVGLDNEDESVVEKIRFEQELVRALDSEQFVLHFQPIINLSTSSLCGFEALIRWNSPKRGLVRPDIFLGIAEETSLIVPLGRWILRKACESFSNIRNEYIQAHGDIPDLFMSINVSAKQVSDPEFFGVLNESIKKYGLRPGDLKLEITESLYAEGTSVNSWLDECKRIGVLVALDDFGTGYSSLSYLSRMNVDNLKVDRSFVKNLVEDPSSQVVVKSIIQMANGLKKPIIAEGIETEEQKKLLTALGCHFGQGYLFGKPMSLEDVLNIWVRIAKSEDEVA